MLARDTRANVGEVVPNAVSPLHWTAIAGPIVEEGWRRALLDFGAFEDGEFRPDGMDMQGVFHGCCYINLDVQWTLCACRGHSRADRSDVLRRAGGRSGVPD